ncbi:MAG: TetR/AcrR family transcriptional regulator [Chloroflexota bacterium]
MPTETFFNLPEEKRARLLDILLDEFSQNDYKNVSVGRIAARAGIAKGSFYQYFADKKNCYLYLIALGIEQKTAFLQQSTPEAPADMFSQIRWLLGVGMQFQFLNPRLAQIGYKAIFDDVPLPEETMQVVRRGGYAYFRQMVQAGIADGSLDPQVDADTAAFLLNATFTNLGEHLMERFGISPASLLSEGSESFQRAEIRRAIEQVIAILENGLRARPQRTERTP